MSDRLGGIRILRDTEIYYIKHNPIRPTIRVDAPMFNLQQQGELRAYDMPHTQPLYMTAEDYSTTLQWVEMGYPVHNINFDVIQTTGNQDSYHYDGVVFTDRTYIDPATGKLLDVVPLDITYEKP